MATEGRMQSSWEQLPEDLWCKVFLHMKADLINRDFLFEHGQRIKEYFGLNSARCVCRKFNDVLCHKIDGVFADLVLGDHVIERNVSSLLTYIKKHSTLIQRLATDRAPWHDIVLTVLHDQQKSSLLTVDLTAATQPTLHLMARFQTITTCTLKEPACQHEEDGNIFSLQGLQALPNLTSLTLVQGHFTDLDAAGHLTKLSLCAAHAACTEGSTCVNSLLDLSVCRSQLSNFHSRGLSACSNLRQLEVVNGSVAAHDAAETMSCHGEFQVPISMSDLTALTTLTVKYYVQEPRERCDWLSQLSNLQHLSFACESKTGLIVLPNTLNELTGLSSLYLGSLNNRARIRCDFNCSSFKLKKVTFLGNVIFNTDLMHLVSVETLKAVDIRHLVCVPFYADVRAHRNKLAKLLRQHRPDVLLDI